MKHLKPGQLFTFREHVYQVKETKDYSCKLCAFNSLIICSNANILCYPQDHKTSYYFKLIK